MKALDKIGLGSEVVLRKLENIVKNDKSIRVREAAEKVLNSLKDSSEK